LLVPFGDFIRSAWRIPVRKVIAAVLVGLGSFLLVAALTVVLWGGDAVKKTPLDTDSVTNLSGTADKLNPATGDVESLQVKAASVTKSDAELSDDDVVVFVNTTCLVIDEDDVPQCVDESDDRLVSATSDVFATDRQTAEAVNDPQYVPPSAEEKSGLVNKWPFDAEKKDYTYWDGMLGEAVDATYDGTETIEGLETYRYHVLIEDAPAEVVADVDGVYSQDKYIWIDPTTGSIVNQTQHEVRELEDGSPLLDMELAFTDEQVEANVSDAEDNTQSLDLLTKTLPLVGFIGGAIALLAGLFLFLRGRRHQHQHA
jgi:Porin PorA